jgi:P27 family predicted phage terminase small subunit
MSKEAQRIWHKLTPQLHEMGVLAEIDAYTLALLCQHWAYALEAIRTIDAEGLFRQDENGVTRKHPAHQILRDSTNMIVRLGSEFGLTPSAREGLQVEMMEADPYETFLAKRTGTR